jgi:uncharacterized protein YndB with AHSA1/START domain
MSALTNSRGIPASPTEIFAAFRDPARLARWWGPAGFTNTFQLCVFQPGGSWVFTMHGPDGHDYANECTFAEIEEPRRLVIRHTCEPLFTLTITLQPTPAGTLLTWHQDFDNPEFAQRLEHILRPCNEQNLDRLTAEVTTPL